MCPAHGEAAMAADKLGRTRCTECVRIRKRVQTIININRQNRSAAGNDGVQFRRHPREVLRKVPNAPLRERYEELLAKGAMTATDIAFAAGYVISRKAERRGGLGDIRRLKKRLGLEDEYGMRDPVTGERPAYRAESVSYDTAVLLCKAMGIEYPAEVGV